MVSLSLLCTKKHLLFSMFLWMTHFFLMFCGVLVVYINTTYLPLTAICLTHFVHTSLFLPPISPIFVVCQILCIILSLLGMTFVVC